MDDWLVWQLIDSTFPSGGFAHSAGLEAAWQSGWIGGAENLTSYLETTLKQIDRGILVFGRSVWREPEQFGDADQACDVFLNNHVSNRASRAQGKALLSSAAATFENDSIRQLSAKAREQRLPTHLAPVFGFITRSLGLDEDRFVSMFLFMSARSMLSAAVRLGIVGPLEAQRIQAKFVANIVGSASADRLLDPAKFNNRSAEADPTRVQRAVQTAPLLDLLQAGQDRLYSRLFQS